MVYQLDFNFLRRGIMKKALLVIMLYIIGTACTDPLDIDDNLDKHHISEDVDETDDLEAVTWDESVIKHLAVGNTWEYEFREYDNFGQTIYSGEHCSKIISDTVISGQTFYIINDNNTEISCQRNSEQGLRILHSFFSDSNSEPMLKFKYPIETNESYQYDGNTISLVAKDFKLKLSIGEFDCSYYRITLSDTHYIDIFMKPGLGLLVEEEYTLNEKSGSKKVISYRELSRFIINSKDSN